MLLPCLLKTRISTASSATNMRPSAAEYPTLGWVSFQSATRVSFAPAATILQRDYYQAYKLFEGLPDYERQEEPPACAKHPIYPMPAECETCAGKRKKQQQPKTKCASHNEAMVKRGSVGGGVCASCGHYIFERELGIGTNQPA